LPAALVAGPLIQLLYGAAFTPSADVLRIHSWTLALVALNTAWTRWVVVEGLHRTAVIFAMLALGSNVLLNWALIPAFGATGAAWATLAAFVPPMLLRLCLPKTRPVALLMLKAALAPSVYAASWLTKRKTGQGGTPT
jgi:O-antigen/teichoic acid export membrane protein